MYFDELSIPVKQANLQFLHRFHLPDICRDRLSGLLEAMKSVKLAKASLLMIGNPSLL